jgi:gas vesicle protein
MSMADYERYGGEGGGGFMMGLLAGTILGAGLGMLLAPKSGSDLRDQLGEQAKNFGNRASEQYRRASETATNWAERGRDMVQQARSAVQRGADEARGYSGSSDSGYTGGSSSAPGSFGGSTGSTGSDYGRS